MLRRTLIAAPLLFLVMGVAATRDIAPTPAAEQTPNNDEALGVDRVNFQLTSDYRSIFRSFEIHLEFNLDDTTFRDMQTVFDSIHSHPPGHLPDNAIEDFEAHFLSRASGDRGSHELVLVAFRELRRRAGLPVDSMQLSPF